jgi:cyclic pyranopterin phosphate synthase
LEVELRVSSLHRVRESEMAKLTHIDGKGRAVMVDVGPKKPTRRKARAEGRVSFNARAFRQLQENRLAKGDAIAVARLAGIQASKRTADWIPLCHSIPLDHVEVAIELEPDERSARVVATVSARWATGVEMEALVAVSAACLTLYDMAKAVDRNATFCDVRLLTKSGGRSGDWRRRGGAR